MEVRTVAAGEEVDIVLVAVRHNLAAEGVLHTVPAAALHTAPVEVGLRTVLGEVVHHIGPAVVDPTAAAVAVHRTGPAEEAADPIAVAAGAVELHTGLEVDRHIDLGEVVHRIAQAAVVDPTAAVVEVHRTDLGADIVDSALVVVRSLGEDLVGSVAAGCRAGPDRVAARSLLVDCMP